MIDFEARLPSAQEVERNVAAGLWKNRSLPLEVRQCAARTPEREAIVDAHGRLTYGELSDMIDRAMIQLTALGVTPGGRVAVQLPNWRHFAIIHLALDALGAVIVPIPLISRASELTYILSLTEAEAVVVVSEYRGFDYREMIEELRPRLPALRHAIVVGPSPSADTFWVPYEDLIARKSEAATPEILSDANRVIEVAFTSGSTGEPKGVMLTANGISADGDTIANACNLNESAVFFMAATLGHQLGFSVGLRMPLSMGARVVYQEHWNPQAAAEIMARERVTFTCSTPTFLVDLLRAPNLNAESLSSLKVWLLAGAVAPASLHEEAKAKLPGLTLATVFSMTEVGAVIINPPGAPPEHALATGRAPRGVELDVRGEDGKTVKRGEEGELVIRTHSLFAGYFRRGQITRECFTVDGFFRSGDRVCIDTAGYLSVTGRIKDLIKRGGESIAPAEIEAILLRHPKIAQAAVVGMPDDRLGEKVCAFVVPKVGETLTLDELLTWFAAAKVAKQKWPERLELAEVLPLTSIGKVHKGALRDLVARKLVDEKRDDR